MHGKLALTVVEEGSDRKLILFRFRIDKCIKFWIALELKYNYFKNSGIHKVPLG